jgi:3-deoxy-manno-octulosonate cytidylyltransferase (CMP-KDO synthetase)
MFRIVIPARYGSTRLPGKPLRLIAGRPMIEYVWRRARSAGAAQVVVATDDARIVAACTALGADVALTDHRHATGTDRLAEVARERRWADDEVVVNVQGDEPLIAPANIVEVATILRATPGAAIATLASPIERLADFEDPNVVKVVCNLQGLALYFSRAPVPWPRDGAAAGDPRRFEGALRHIGLYAYRVAALRRLAALPPARLETAERLEQLRALENGLAIAVGVAAESPGPGVDTEADLARVEALLGAAQP